MDDYIHETLIRQRVADAEHHAAITRLLRDAERPASRRGVRAAVAAWLERTTPRVLLPSFLRPRTAHR
ncbi:MAG: hypothetical protein FJZ38_17370 [Candidatus Rokubacteria bacterium]|nr:hypothetical protein [Candidatus Rokubacteria bacterium]